jgi:hypothetical protein
MTRAGLLSRAVESSKPLLTRYLAGFDDSNHTVQAANLPNHCAWTLGHVALTLHRAAEHARGGELPLTNFHTTADHPRPLATFYTESVAFGSIPRADPSAYPRFERCREVFESECDLLASVVRDLDDASLDRPLKWGTSRTTVGDLVVRMVFHTGIHAGQLSDLRRALGMGSVFR